MLSQKKQDYLQKRLREASRLANKCDSLFSKIQKRMNTVSPYTRRGQAEYSRKMLSMNKMLEKSEQQVDLKSAEAMVRAAT